MHTTMGAFLTAITMMCQNHKLSVPVLPGESEVESVVFLKTEEEKTCLKRMYHSCNKFVPGSKYPGETNPMVIKEQKQELIDCMAKNL